MFTAHEFSCPIQDPQSFAHGELLSICNIGYCYAKAIIRITTYLHCKHLQKILIRVYSKIRSYYFSTFYSLFLDKAKGRICVLKLFVLKQNVLLLLDRTQL